ncbi:MAG: hypothetical protein Q8O72_00250 [Bacteroidales bacterium]|nr:hypothetical protein [Bacteroidales bacterium]
MKIAKPFTGILAFIVVLITMPLGHATMIAMDALLGHQYIYLAAGMLGFTGLFLAIWGVVLNKQVPSTFLGLFAGLFIWTGWIEFSFVYFSRRYEVAPLLENGVVVTKPEYLLMPSSIGFLSVILIYYLLSSKSGCQFFSWFQQKLNISRFIQLRPSRHPIAITTMMEVIVILWTFYLLLLFVYDSTFFGDRHLATYVVAFGSLLWSGILVVRLLRINSIAYAIRYAIPTVIIFWNFVEILGRWNLLKEIWIEPMNYPLEMTVFFGVMVLLILYATMGSKQQRPVRVSEHQNRSPRK